MPIVLATFNVKDLFEPEPAKLDNLARFFAEMGADVVGLQEVGSEASLAALLARVPELGYTERVVGTADARGIRNVLVSRLPVVTSRVHTAAVLDFPRFSVIDPPPFGTRIPLRRGVPYARVRAPSTGDVDIFVAHFKSGRPVLELDGNGAPIEPRTERERAAGDLRALVWRASEALFVRSLVDEVLVADPLAKVAVVGDLNDTLASLPVRVVCGTSLLPCAVGHSILHGNVFAQIDHVLASVPLAQRVQEARFLNESLRDHSALEPNDLPTADSDHAPVVVRFG